MKKLLTFIALTLSAGLWAIDDAAYLAANGKERIAEGVIEVTNASSQVTWNAGWYVVTGTDVQLSKGAICAGAVHIILADGAKLTATGGIGKAGIQVSGKGNSLTIYAQSTGDQMGKLTATGGQQGAGIGGGAAGSGSNITINGGEVTANGGFAAAGIGGGNEGDGSDITITGGTVTANGGYMGAGIGGGEFGNGSDIIINGGKVTANGGSGSAGIGGGSVGSGSNITINGGEVTAIGGENAAGIGGGEAGSCSNITINGGEVTATGGVMAAGIGGGSGIASNIKVATTLVVKADNNNPPTKVIAPTRTDDTDIADDLVGKQYATVGTPVEKITLTAADFTVTKDGDWTYDQTEKRVNVEFISVENPEPPADKVEIYYNNDKTVKPIDPGTYQVYIDIEETDTYAAVTGITSEAWKFDITMPTFVEGGLKFEVTSLDPKTVKVIANDYTGSSFTIPATVSYLEDDYAVTAIGENAFAGVGTATAPADLLLPADWEGTKPAATATLWYGGYFVDYRAAAIAEIKAASDEAENLIEEAATGFVGIEDVKQAKANAASTLADAQAAADNTIGAAANMIAIANAKSDAITAMHMATDEAVVAIEAAIVSFREGTMDEIEYVANGAKEEIDGLGVDESAKSEAKAQIDNIAHTAEQTINTATNKDAIDNAKTEAIAKIYNVVQNLKDMWVIVRTDGVVGNWNTICLPNNITAIDGATFWTVSGQDATSFILDEVTEPEAGQGYLIRFTAAELKVKYGDQVAANPVTATYGTPVQGTYTQIDFDQEGQNELVGNYVVYQNQLCPVEAWVGLLAHRAYVVAEYVPNNVPAPAPGRARAYMPKPKETPTGIGQWNKEQGQRTGKFLHNGQLIIVKDNQMYNAQGMKL